MIVNFISTSDSQIQTDIYLMFVACFEIFIEHQYHKKMTQLIKNPKANSLL